MSGRASKIVDWFLGGRGDQSITVPVMDGALKPNNYLEQVASIATIAGADNLIEAQGRILLSSANRLLELHDDGRTVIQTTCDADISFLCVSPEGAIAMGLDDNGLVIRSGRHHGKRISRNLSGQALNCPTAAVFLDEDTLIVCNGSASASAADWSHDLLRLGRSGSVLRLDLTHDTADLLCSGLGFPAGIAVTPDGRLVVSEAWRHRLLTMNGDGSDLRVALADQPAYPGRIIASQEGGYWLAMFAVRSQLQEFVLREDRYRREMMATINPEYWIAPTLSSGRSFKEPLQAGSVIRLGIHKPWAPTRSYGLLVRLDEQLQPVWSAHSRADGNRHGITGCLETDGRLLVASKGLGAVLQVDHLKMAEPEDIAMQIGSVA